MSDKVEYTDPARVLAMGMDSKPFLVKHPDAAPRSKVPTRYMIHYKGRWRRVYVMQYGNSGSAYIVCGGKDLFLDIATEHELEDVMPNQRVTN